MSDTTKKISRILHESKVYKKQLKWGMEKGVLSTSGQGVKRENLVVAYRL
jgi:hypothetical protein